MTDRIDAISDSILVSGIRENDTDAFKSLYYRYSKRIFSFSIRFLGNKEEAEELVQNVFINLWEQRITLDETQSVKSYIFRSAVNYITNQLKRRAIRKRFVDFEQSKGEPVSNSVYEEIFFHDLERSINTVVSALPARQQKIFRLSRYEGLSYREIADKLDISVRTVENLMYRVLKILRRILKDF